MHQTEDQDDLQELLNNFQQVQRRLRKNKENWSRSFKEKQNGFPISSNYLNTLQELNEMEVQIGNILMIEMDEYIPYFVIPQLIDDVNEMSDTRIKFPQ